MKKPYLISLLPTLFICNSSAAVELSKHLSTSTEPTPKVRVEPKYPISAARASREGWAKLSFIIEKDGSVSNVITKETSGSKDFTQAAKKAVMKWRYEPAMENGEPVQQCVNDVQFDFRADKNGTKTVTRRFKSLYSKANAALESKDYASAEQHLKSFSRIKYMHLSENNFLQLLHARYAKEMGDEAKQLSHLNKVKFAFNEQNNKQELALLEQRFILEVKLNRLKSAYNTFKRIEKMAMTATDLAGYRKLLQQVDDFVNSEKELVVSANIRSNDYWHYALVRNEFTLTNIVGELTKMDIRCANKRHVYSIENNNTWKIPAAWQQCQVYIFGENNATFNLVEHPFST